MATSALSRVTLPGGLGMQYAERGRGPAILFLHGFGDSWYSFDAVVAESLKLPARVWQAVIPGILARRPGRGLAELRMPTLIVWGEHDAICPRVEQHRLHDAIAGSTLAIYEETGHAPNWEQPDRFVVDLLAFVRGRPVDGAPATPS